MNFVPCHSCRDKFKKSLFEGFSLNSNKRKWKQLSKKTRNIVNSKHEFLFALNNFSNRLKGGQFDITTKHKSIYICPWHLVLKNPEIKSKYFRVVNNATYFWKCFLALNHIIDDKFGAMEVPQLKDYALLILSKAGKNGYANVTDLTAAFHQLTFLSW